MRFLRNNASWIFASLLCVSCTSTNATVPPQPSSSPPIVMGAGTLAVVNEHDGAAKTVWAFPPQSKDFTRQLLMPGSQIRPNSLAFDRLGNLYVGFNDSSSSGKYNVVEWNVSSGEVVRHLLLPQWSDSSVATDAENSVYVNTKSFVGGDVNIFAENPAETKPYIVIKDHRRPLMTAVTRLALWVGYEQIGSYALARYALRSTHRAALHSIGDNRPRTIVESNDGQLIAVLVSRHSGGRAVDVIDVHSGKVARTLIAGSRLDAMTSDRSGRIYIAQSQPGQSPDAEIHVCTFSGCLSAFKTDWGQVVGLAVSPLDGMLYASFIPKPVVQVYDPRNGKPGLLIAPKDFAPRALAIEP